MESECLAYGENGLILSLNHQKDIYLQDVKQNFFIQIK